MIGDVIGRTGRTLLLDHLMEIRAVENIDIVIANGENSAGGLGITSKTYRAMKQAGVDIITLGNHLWDKSDIYSIIENDDVIRPLNYPGKVEGEGVRIFEEAGLRFAVVSLLGRVYMPRGECPFRAMDKVIENLKKDGINIIIVDFHAEATSEKIAMGFYLDSRISLIAGTHTHVQTNDSRVLSGGTGYITDIGMTGDRESVIGIDKDIIIEKFLLQQPRRFKVGNKKPMINAVIAAVDKKTGLCKSIKKINKDLDF